MSRKGIPGRGLAGKGCGWRGHHGDQCGWSGVSKREGVSSEARGAGERSLAQHFQYCSSSGYWVRSPNPDSVSLLWGQEFHYCKHGWKTPAVSVTVMSITHRIVSPEYAVPVKWPLPYVACLLATLCLSLSRENFNF